MSLYDVEWVTWLILILLGYLKIVFTPRWPKKKWKDEFYTLFIRFTFYQNIKEFLNLNMYGTFGRLYTYVLIPSTFLFEWVYGSHLPISVTPPYFLVLTCLILHYSYLLLSMKIKRTQIHLTRIVKRLTTIEDFSFMSIGFWVYKKTL